MKYNVVILGGTDGFGKWLAEYTLRHFPKNISMTLTGRNREKGEKVAQELGVDYCNNNQEAVKNADIVIYATPISVQEQTIHETLAYVKEGAILVDITSMKVFPSKALKLCKKRGVIIIPTHPMFGPYIYDIAGQVIVLTPEESTKNTKAYLFLKSFLETQKAKVIETTPLYHDQMMAVVQGLTHFNMFVVGETMKRLQFDIAKSMDFISPIYKLMISSVGRYLGQNPRLYADIQMYNQEVLKVHEIFLETSKDFHRSVKNQDVEKFCTDILEARNFLGEENCREGQEYTDKVIYLLGKQLELLREKKDSIITLKNIYSGETVSGKLLDFSSEKIFLDDTKTYILNQWEVL